MFLVTTSSAPVPDLLQCKWHVLKTATVVTAIESVLRHHTVSTLSGYVHNCICNLSEVKKVNRKLKLPFGGFKLKSV